MATKLKERTIQFYEVLHEAEGEQLRMTQQQWPKFLEVLGRTDLPSRIMPSDRDIIGQTWGHEGEDRLVLHKVRDAGDWLARVNFQSEEITELEAAAGEGLLDSSAIYFLKFGNVVALMQGSTSSPSHKSLENYLNHLNPFGLGATLKVRPLVAQAELERLQQATQVSRIEIKLGTRHVRALHGKQSSLAKWIRGTKRFGDVDVTMVISVPRGKQHADQRYTLAQELSDLSDVLPGAADAARATLYYGPDDELGRGRVAELVEHNITAKRRVAAVDDQGNSIRFNGAFHVMDTAATELENQLKAAADTD